ncbi:MAG: hypothetical protein R2939_06215 [Kofleriaceae bacterium]
MPPVRLDLGTLAMRDEGAPAMASELLVGLHWASLHPGDPGVDVGVGMVMTFTSLPDDLRLPGARKDVDGYVGTTGGYLELAKKIAGGTTGAPGSPAAASSAAAPSAAATSSRWGPPRG